MLSVYNNMSICCACKSICRGSIFYIGNCIFSLFFSIDYETLDVVLRLFGIEI
jgi:hypothetical protein